MSIELNLDIQSALVDEMEWQKLLPTHQEMQKCVETVLQNGQWVGEAQLTLRFVEDEEISELNQTYRKKSGATNVLSFPFDAPSAVLIPLLGDIVLCASVIRSEAQEQHKQLRHHCIHMIVHGTLHLLGFDHINENEALEMESKEITILSSLEIANPYISSTTNIKSALLSS